MLLLATPIVVVGAGCGRGESNNNSAAPSAQSNFSDYEAAMQALGHSLGIALIDAGRASRDASSAAIVRNLRRSQTELRAAAVKLAKITAPGRIKAQHEALLPAVRVYAVELDTVIAQVKNGGGAQILSTIGTLADITAMGRASAATQKAGYGIIDG